MGRCRLNVQSWRLPSFSDCHAVNLGIVLAVAIVTLAIVLNDSEVTIGDFSIAADLELHLTVISGLGSLPLEEEVTFEVLNPFSI